jgi:hypothetical protein
MQRAGTSNVYSGPFDADVKPALRQLQGEDVVR